MPYTLTIGLSWFALAFVIGIVTGVLLRSVVAGRQVARERSHTAAVRSDLEAVRERLAMVQYDSPADAEVAAPATERADRGDRRPVAAPAPDVPVGAGVGTSAASPDHDAVHVDDLTRIVGLGPAVAELCRGIGILSWRDLADTEVSLLRTMLTDAGPRSRAQDPRTWPQQARLLADGRWDEFEALVATFERPDGPVDPDGDHDVGSAP